MTFLSKRLASRFLSHASILAAAIAAFLPVSANAANLAESFKSVILEVDNLEPIFGTTDGNYSLSGLAGSVNAFLAEVNGKASGESSGASNSMSAGLTYSYVINGPAIDLLVPMFATFHLGATATGGLPGSEVLANATLFIRGVNGTSIGRQEIAQSCPGCGPLDFRGTLSFLQLSGHFDRVELSVAASTSAGAGISALATAFVDPYIFIDPAWLADHPGYSVAVSAGIGNAAPGVAAIPEPQTYAMMLAGLGLLGFAVRRRKNKTA